MHSAAEFSLNSTRFGRLAEMMHLTAPLCFVRESTRLQFEVPYLTRNSSYTIDSIVSELAAISVQMLVVMYSKHKVYSSGSFFRSSSPGYFLECFCILQPEFFSKTKNRGEEYASVLPLHGSVLQNVGFPSTYVDEERMILTSSKRRRAVNWDPARRLTMPAFSRP